MNDSPYLLDARVSNAIGDPPRFSFMPSTDWNHAMLAAEKAFPDGFVIRFMRGTWTAYGNRRCDAVGVSETGPEAVCWAILGEG